MINKEILKKWEPLLESEDFPKIKDSYRKEVTAMILENTEKAMKTENSWTSGSLTEALLNEGPVPANVTPNVQNYDPVLINMLRRTMPNLVAYDILGVQPMSGPTGLIFALRNKYVLANNDLGAEAGYEEVDTTYSGTGTQTDQTGLAHTITFGTGETTLTMETNTNFNEMAVEVERVQVTAKTRALKAEWSVELAQDMKAVHNLDIEAELTNLLTKEVLGEINREVIRTVYGVAKTGSQTGVTTPGTFDLDTDSNGRWMNEKHAGLMFQIELERNTIAKESRRGRGNIVLCSSNVASALSNAGMRWDNAAPLNPDDTGNTYVGTLPTGVRVYIDPYAGGDYMVVGYKGASPFDAGVFYCPYVPLQMVKAVGENSFQPKIGFRTRYGMVANPFAEGAAKGAGALTPNSNVYYRRTLVRNIM